MGFLPKIRKSRDFNHDTTPRETKRDQRRPTRPSERSHEATAAPAQCHRPFATPRSGSRPSRPVPYATSRSGDQTHEQEDNDEVDYIYGYVRQPLTSRSYPHDAVFFLEKDTKGLFQGAVANVSLSFAEHGRRTSLFELMTPTVDRPIIICALFPRPGYIQDAGGLACLVSHRYPGWSHRDRDSMSS